VRSTFAGNYSCQPALMGYGVFLLYRILKLLIKHSFQHNSTFLETYKQHIPPDVTNYIEKKTKAKDTYQLRHLQMDK